MSNELTTTIDIAKVLIRTGSNAERLISKTMQGETAYITDSKRVIVGDGFTIGGHNVGNILYGIGGNSISLSALPLSSNNSGFTYAGDTYFCNSTNSYYTLTGTNVENLDSYKQIVTKTTGDNITTTRSASGALSLLPLSANSLFSNIGAGGIVVNGDYLTLGSTISTNLITYLDYSNSPFYTAMKVESSAINYYRITTNTLKFAPTSLSQLELPKYLKYGSAEVNILQSNWNEQQNISTLYKNASNVIELSATPTSRLQFFDTPIDVVKQLGVPSGAFELDFTTLSTSNVFGIDKTLSGFKATYNTILFTGTYTNNIINSSSLKIEHRDVLNTPFTLYYYNAPVNYTRSFYFFLPLKAATAFKYSIGKASLVFTHYVYTTTATNFTLSAIAAI